MTDHEIDRSLIDAAREGLAPTSRDRSRLRGAVMAAVAGGAAAGTAGVAAGASAAAKGAGVLGVWTAGKIAIVGIATVAVIAAGTWAAMGPAAEDVDAVAEDGTTARQTTAGTAPAARPILASPEAPPAAAPEPADETAPAVLAPAATPPGRAREVARRPTAPIAAAPGPAATPETLLGETALLREAHRALQSGDPTRALAQLDAHAARFPDGALAEERLATRVLALCAAGRDAEARADATRFITAHPRSPHATRVRTACD